MIKISNKNMIRHELLDKSESIGFIKFLKDEIIRHRWNKIESERWSLYYRNIPVLKKAWESSSERHQEDIDMSQKTIDYLKKKWKL